MENIKSRLKGKTWVAIVLVALFGQIAWAIENNFFNLFIQDVFHASFVQIAIMVASSAIAATLTTLLIGALSDKIGKRKLFICIGYIVWGITIIIFAILQNWATHLETLLGVSSATIGVSLVIIFDCIMTFFGSSANDACFNAWLTDITDESNRGKAEGVNSAMPLLAMLLVFGGAMLIPNNNPELTHNYNAIFLIIGIAVIIVGIVCFFLIEEPVKEKTNEPYFKNIIYGFRPSVVKNNKILYLVFATFAVFSISLQVFMPYYVIYLSKIIGDSYVFIMAPAIVVAAAFTVFYGRIIDKYGFVKAIIPVFISYVIGLLIMFFFNQTALIFIGSLLMLSGYLAGNACFGAMMRDYTPKENVGSFQGIRITVQVLIPMLTGPFIGAAVCQGDSFGFGIVADGYIPSPLIYLFGAIVALPVIAGIVLIYKKLQKKEKPVIEESETKDEK